MKMKDIKVYKNAYILIEDGVIVEVEGRFNEDGFSGEVNTCWRKG